MPEYPFVGGHRDGQLFDVGGDPWVVALPFAEPADPDGLDPWDAVERTFGSETYRREKFSILVRMGDRSVERCEWQIYLCGSIETAPDPWWVVLSRAPDRRVVVEPIIDRGAWLSPPAMPASELVQMGASWI